MIDNGYLFAKDENRLFVNPSLGCMGACKFCYLSKMGIDKINSKISDEIISDLEKSGYKYNENTLITLGCFSECFDDINKSESIKLIEYFLKKGNQVQVSTKRCVSLDDIACLLPLIKYYGQLVIFVSSATIGEYKEYENNTEELSSRFKTFDLNNKIPVVLYIKPVIQDVTIKDVDKYIKLIKEKHISYVVVGSLFTEEESLEAIHFSSNNKLFYNACKDEDEIISKLDRLAIVKRRSSEVMHLLKSNNDTISKIKKEVEDILKDDDTGHNISHIERVYNLSVEFAKMEYANVFVTSLISLLHEVDDYKIVGLDDASKLTNSKNIMNKYKMDEDVQKQVLSELKMIGYKKSLKGIRPKTLEGMIVSDADMCDALGVLGILRTYDYHKAHNKPFFDKSIFPEELKEENYAICDASSVSHCFRKLLRLKGLMMTDAGKKEAKERHEIIVLVLKHLFEEERANDWQEYLDNFLKNLDN